MNKDGSHVYLSHTHARSFYKSLCHFYSLNHKEVEKTLLPINMKNDAKSQDDKK